jgi:hypothetical protein
MQEHDRRRVLRTSLAIENSGAINRHAMIGRCRLGRGLITAAHQRSWADETTSDPKLIARQKRLGLVPRD